MIAHRQFGEEVYYVLPGHIPRRQRHLTLLGQGYPQEIFLPFLLRDKGLRLALHLVAQQEHPVLVADETVQVGGIIPDGIQPAHYCPYAGTGYVIHWDANLLKHLEHSHFGCTLGTTASQHQSHLLAGRLVLRESVQRQAAQNEQQTDEPSYVHILNV